MAKQWRWLEAAAPRQLKRVAHNMQESNILKKHRPKSPSRSKFKHVHNEALKTKFLPNMSAVMLKALTVALLVSLGVLLAPTERNGAS